MRVKVVSISVILALCLSFISALFLPLDGRVEASPMQTLTEVYQATAFLDGNTRSVPLQAGDEVVQFGRSNLVLGTDPYCTLTTVARSSGDVTGDLPGHLAVEYHSLYATWNELPLGTAKGYMIGKAVFTDHFGNTMIGVWVSDVDYTHPDIGVTVAEGDTWYLYHSGTGAYSGQVAVGSGHAVGTYVDGLGTIDQSATYSVRLYSADEIHGPYDTSGTVDDQGCSAGGPLGPSVGLQMSDEFLRFTEGNVFTTKGSTDVTYCAGGLLTVTDLDSVPDMTNHWDAIFYGPPDYMGINVGRMGGADSSGTLDGILVSDVQAPATGNSYFFALMENATGAYSGKDYFTRDGYLYILAPPDVPTDPGSGTWFVETVDSTSPYSILFPSLAFDSQGHPAIAYLDDSLDLLRYTRQVDTDWVTETVAAVNAQYPSLAFDRLGSPAISYGCAEGLKYAQWNGSGWNIQTVAPNPGFPSTSLAFSPLGLPSISYCGGGGGDLRLAQWNGAWWDIQTIDVSGGSHSLAFDSSGDPAIAYAGNGGLRLAVWNGTSWDMELVDENAEGWFCSLAFGSSGRPAISYTEIMHGMVKYAEWSGSAWDIVTLASTPATTGQTSLAFDPMGQPVVSYDGGDETQYSLRCATRTGTGWVHETVDTGCGAVYKSLALDDAGLPAIAYSAFSTRSLKYAYYDAPPSVPTATGSGTASLVPSSGSIQNLTAVPESSLPEEGKPQDVDFPHGFFEFDITGLTPGQSVTLTITLPSPVPMTAEYWKYGPTQSDPISHWYQIPMGDNDGDNVITITLVDGGLGDDDLLADGTIIDQGGPAWPPVLSGGRGVPVFPSIYIGIGAALGAGLLAYLLRRRMIAS